MKKAALYLMVLVLCLSLLAVGCDEKSNDTQGEQQEKLTLKFGSVVPQDHTLTKNMEEFAEIIKEKTNGRITIDIYPQAQLGSNREMAEQLQMGTLDMHCVSAAAMSQFSDAFLIFDLPYLFKTDEAAKEVFNGSVGKKISSDLEKANMKTLCIITQGWRHISANKEIRKPEDLKGVKIRILATPVFQEFFAGVGASPTPMAFAEVYSGLQQGVIDAQENPFEMIKKMHFEEVQDYVMTDGHVYDAVLFNISMKTWNKLSPEDQAIFEEAAKVIVEQNFKATRETNSNIKESYIEKGKPKIIKLTHDEIMAFRKVAQPVYDKFASVIGEDLIKEVEDYQKDMKYERNY